MRNTPSLNVSRQVLVYLDGQMNVSRQVLVYVHGQKLVYFRMVKMVEEKSIVITYFWLLCHSKVLSLSLSLCWTLGH